MICSPVCNGGYTQNPVLVSSATGVARDVDGNVFSPVENMDFSQLEKQTFVKASTNFSNEFTSASSTQSNNSSNQTFEFTHDFDFSTSNNNDLITFSQSRDWMTRYYDALQIHENPNIIVKVKTRREKATTEVPDVIYASLKYIFSISLDRSAFKNNNNNIPFVLARIALVDTVTNEVVNEKPIKGDLEKSINFDSSNDLNRLTGQLIAQVQSCYSYVKKKRKYLFRLSMYDPSNLNVPILVTDSKAFKIYARKPNKKNYVEEKKKREQIARSIHKGMNSENHINGNIVSNEKPLSKNLHKFINRMEDLLQLKDILSDEEKQFAFKILQKRIQM